MWDTWRLTRVQPDPRVRAFFLARVGGRGPVNLVLLGHTSRAPLRSTRAASPSARICASTWRNRAMSLNGCGEQAPSSVAAGSLAAQRLCRSGALRSRARFFSNGCARVLARSRKSSLRSTLSRLAGGRQSSLPEPRLRCQTLVMRPFQPSLFSCRFGAAPSHLLRVCPNHALKGTRRYGRRSWRSFVAAGPLTWSC